MESLDWSDPSKLIRRDGGEVLACGKNEGLSGPQACWAVTRKANEPPTLNPFWNTGECLSNKSPCVFDIIPRPREPRTCEVWISPQVFDSQRFETFVAYTEAMSPETQKVKVRITEVIE